MNDQGKREAVERALGPLWGEEGWAGVLDALAEMIVVPVEVEHSKHWTIIKQEEFGNLPNRIIIPKVDNPPGPALAIILSLPVPGMRQGADREEGDAPD